MNAVKWMKRFAAIVGSAATGLLLATGANAANPEPVVVEVEFAAAITIAETNALQFGLLDTAMVASDTVAIDTASAVTDPQSNVIGGTQSAAKFNTTAAPSKPITILVNNITNGTYYTLGSFVCDYNAGTPGACDGGGLSETSTSGTIEVRVGATLTGAGGAVAGVDNGSFDLTITYQ